MSSAFCSLEDAFTGPVLPPKKKKTRGSGREVPAAIEGFESKSVDPDRQVQAPPPGEVLTGPTGSGKLSSGSGTGVEDFFPLPGATAAAEEWQKAFTLEPSMLPRVGGLPVEGKPTLWRDIPVPAAAVSAAAAATMSAIPSDISQRLDTLTRQLEALTTPTPLQSTAELFLFVAIGLLLLLAIDTLLRFATSMAQRGSARSWWSGRGGRRFR